MTLNPESESAKNEDVVKATLVRITPKILHNMEAFARPMAAVKWPAQGGASNSVVNVNDVLQITIYESQTGGLFVPQEAGVRPGNYVTLPLQEIDRTGEVMVPYAGAVNVLGKSPSKISSEIAEQLSNRAIEPQVVVSVVERRGAEVSVLGDIRSPLSYSLLPEGNRIMDAIARAGGPIGPEYDSYVTLHRGQNEYRIRLADIVEAPSLNTYLRAKDTIYVSRQPETFQIFGAAGFSGVHEFEKTDITLAEALGRAQGLRDDLADPAEIYLFRHENLAYMKDIDGLDYTQYEAGDESTTTPIIFKINLREPSGYFMAQNFEVMDEDVIYVANSESVEFSKFLSFLTNFSGTKIISQNAAQQ